MIKDKINLNKYCGGQILNFPPQYDLQIELNPNRNNLIIYYIDCLDDIKAFINCCEQSNLEADNRCIFVYEKGRKDDVNRDALVSFFRNETSPFKMRKPMLFSINDKLSGFCQSYERRELDES